MIDVGTTVMGSCSEEEKLTQIQEKLRILSQGAG